VWWLSSLLQSSEVLNYQFFYWRPTRHWSWILLFRPSSQETLLLADMTTKYSFSLLLFLTYFLFPPFLFFSFCSSGCISSFLTVSFSSSGAGLSTALGVMCILVLSTCDVDGVNLSCGCYSRRCWRKCSSTATFCSQSCLLSRCFSNSSLTGHSATFATASTSLTASSSFSGRSTPLSHQHSLPTPSSCVNMSTPWPEKRGQSFFLQNFNKCRQSFVISGLNHPEDSFY